VGLSGQVAATTASDTTPDGEALARVVVVGLGFQVIEVSVGGAGGREGAGLGEEFMEEPPPVGTGTDGADEEASRGRGH
jgi:hypothetical protein